MKKIKELQKRNILNEGRNFGIGFSILNKIKNNFETHMPFSACRDYLNDFIFVEREKKEIGNVHGYNHKLLNCFNRKHYFYLGVNTLNYNSGNSWNEKEKATNILIENYKNLELLLNHIESNLGLKYRSLIMLDEDTLIIKVPIYWSKTTPLISIYTLLIRCFFNINDVSIINSEILLNHKSFISSDNYFINNCVDFYNKIGINNFDKINYKDFKISYTNRHSVHNFGIVGYLTNKKI